MSEKLERPGRQLSTGEWASTSTVGCDGSVLTLSYSSTTRLRRCWPACRLALWKTQCDGSAITMSATTLLPEQSNCTPTRAASGRRNGDERHSTVTSASFLPSNGSSAADLYTTSRRAGPTADGSNRACQYTSLAPRNAR